jgi:hypothetical protein
LVAAAKAWATLAFAAFINSPAPGFNMLASKKTRRLGRMISLSLSLHVFVVMFYII